MVSEVRPRPLYPLHISSEAPEVVPEDQSPYLTSPDKYFVRSYSARRTSNRLITTSPLYADNTPIEEFPLSRRAYELAPYRPPPEQRKKIRLVPFVLVTMMAFFAGGGIGGGIGSWAEKHANASSTSKSEATSTSSAIPSATTIIVDSAFCPIVNNATYNTTNPAATFLIACQVDLAASPGEDIDLGNLTTSTLDDCIDSCAAYNEGQCLAATWIQFSPASPEMNSKCFFKANSGVAIPSNATGTTATSAYRMSVSNK